MKIFARNRRALHDYTVIRKLEAGIVLNGDEVKSIRNNLVNLSAAYAVIVGGQLELLNCQITPYHHAYSKNTGKEDRTRVLLVHKRELKILLGEVSAKSMTLIPLSFYESEKRLIKVEIAVCKHKKQYERKEEIREKDIARETRRELKGKYDY